MIKYFFETNDERKITNDNSVKNISSFSKEEDIKSKQKT